MVSLKEVRTSNSRITSTLPSKLVAVFVGATSGIGEATLKQFAKHTRQPRIYVVGRSQQSADRITKECQELNPGGEYIFIKVTDISLMHTVDDVCKDILAKEKAINLLFLSCGTMTFKTGEFPLQKRSAPIP
jgi:NADP-dependent 3-hydroxy acid dehydrogenase YdfG